MDFSKLLETTQSMTIIVIYGLFVNPFLCMWYTTYTSSNTDTRNTTTYQCIIARNIYTLMYL